MASLELFEYATAGRIYEDGHAIRLVQLVKGTGPEIVCHLLKSFIHEAGIPYEALSYTWGSSEKTKLVTLNDKNFWITENLYEALRCLRREDEDRILWVDAICINQGHLEERNHQVMHMASIYREAERVIFWLGPSTCYMDTLMITLKRLQQAAMKKVCRNWALKDNRWREMWLEVTLGASLERECIVGLKSALERPWFQRVWILQECAHAKAGIVACGQYYVAAQMFVLAPSLLQVSLGPHCQQVLEIMPGFRRNRLATHQLDMFNLLLKFQHSEASEERDKIYALYSMASDNEKLPLMDYGQPLNELFTDMLRTFFPFHRWQMHEVHSLYRYEKVHLFISNLEKINNIAMICAAQNREIEVLQEFHARPGSNINFMDESGNSTLSVAAKLGYEDIVRFLLGVSTIDVNIKDHELRTPLHISVIMGYSEVVRSLLSHEMIEPSSQDRYGSTPLHLAVERKYRKIIQLLLESSRTYPSLQDNDGETPVSIAEKLRADDPNSFELACYLKPLETDVTRAIWHAIETGGVEKYCSLVKTNSFASVFPKVKRRTQNSIKLQRIFARLLSRVDDQMATNAQDESDQTILQWAISKRRFALSSALLKNRIIDINARDRNLDTSLNIAIIQGDKDSFNALINHKKIDINVQNKNRQSPLMLAHMQKNTNFFDALLSRNEINVNAQNENGNTSLALTVLEENMYCFTALLNHSEINVNAQNQDGNTPLALAILGENTHFFTALLNHSEINFNTQNEDGNTPLALAVLGENMHFFIALLSRSEININTQNQDGNTPLALTVLGSNPYFSHLLLSRSEININTQNRDRDTPLALAVSTNNMHSFDVLLNYNGININTRDKNGNAPLAQAVLKNRIYFCRALVVTAGIEINTKNDIGETPLTMAIRNGNSTLIKILVNTAGIDINMATGEGDTPLTLAVSKGFGGIEITNILLAIDGIDINATNNIGESIWIIAENTGCADLQALLPPKPRPQKRRRY